MTGLGSLLVSLVRAVWVSMICCEIDAASFCLSGSIVLCSSGMLCFSTSTAVVESGDG